MELTTQGEFSNSPHTSELPPHAPISEYYPGSESSKTGRYSSGSGKKPTKSEEILMSVLSLDEENETDFFSDPGLGTPQWTKTFIEFLTFC